jgi:hypothetical protein
MQTLTIQLTYCIKVVVRDLGGTLLVVTHAYSKYVCAHVCVTMRACVRARMCCARVCVDVCVRARVWAGVLSRVCASAMR